MDNEESELVRTYITRNLLGTDAELDCMDCLNQIMREFREALSEDERKRVAVWFLARYRG